MLTLFSAVYDKRIHSFMEDERHASYTQVNRSSTYQCILLIKQYFTNVQISLPLNSWPWHDRPGGRLTVEWNRGQRTLAERWEAW